MIIYRTCRIRKKSSFQLKFEKNLAQFEPRKKSSPIWFGSEKKPDTTCFECLEKPTYFLKSSTARPGQSQSPTRSLTQKSGLFRARSKTWPQGLLCISSCSHIKHQQEILDCNLYYVHVVFCWPLKLIAPVINIARDWFLVWIMYLIFKFNTIYVIILASLK